MTSKVALCLYTQQCFPCVFPAECSYVEEVNAVNARRMRARVTVANHPVSGPDPENFGLVELMLSVINYDLVWHVYP